MVIFELGIVKSGVPLVSRQYYKDYNVNVDPVLRGGFLSGLNAFVQEVFSDKIDSFSMENFKIAFISYFLKHTKGESIILYCIGDKNLNLKFANKALTYVLDKFLEKYNELKDFIGDVKIFDEFNQTIDDILGDLAKKPDDRFRSVFE